MRLKELSRRWNLFRWRLAEKMYGGKGWVKIVEESYKGTDEAERLLKLLKNSRST